LFSEGSWLRINNHPFRWAHGIVRNVPRATLNTEPCGDTDQRARLGIFDQVDALAGQQLGVKVIEKG
jgi:hypothetical protein